VISWIVLPRHGVRFAKYALQNLAIKDIQGLNSGLVLGTRTARPHRAKAQISGFPGTLPINLFALRAQYGRAVRAPSRTELNADRPSALPTDGTGPANNIYLFGTLEIEERVYCRGVRGPVYNFAREESFGSS
jgi:hypothetical protein